MRKIGITLLIGLLGLCLIPTASAAGVSFLTPSGEEFERGDTVSIDVQTYGADATGTIQIQIDGSIIWIDQDNFAGGHLTYDIVVPEFWGGGTYTIRIETNIGSTDSTTFKVKVPTFLPQIPPSPETPSVDDIEGMTTSQAVDVIEALDVDDASDIITQLSITKATAIIKRLDTTFVIDIFEDGIADGDTAQLSKLINELDPSAAAEILLDIESELGAALVEEMVTDDLTAAALRVEEAVKQSGNTEKLAEFGGTLTGVPAATLVSLFREIVGLPATPSTVAELFEVLSITKVIDINDAWMDTEDYEGLATVFSYLSDAKLEEIYLSMSGAQRTTIYPYLDAESQARLPDQGELSVSNLSVTPETVEIGEIVTISVTVINDGLIQFTEGVTLKVDGISIESEMVTLMPDESETITWTVSEATSGTYSVDVNGLTGSFTVEEPPEPLPANIIYNSIGVSPTSVEAGDPVTVTVTLENTGELSGIESIELTVNDEVVDIKDLTVAGGDTESTTFTVTEDEPGTYTVEAGEKSATFTVTEPPPPPPSQFPWTYAVIAVVIIAVAAYIYMQQQKQ